VELERSLTKTTRMEASKQTIAMIQEHSKRLRLRSSTTDFAEKIFLTPDDFDTIQIWKMGSR